MKCSDECCPDKPTRHCENPDRAVWGLKVSTIGRRLAAIAVAHRKAGVPDHELPTRDHRVRAVWKGIRRTTGVAKAKKKGIEVEQHCDLAMSFGTSTSDLRDKALLLLTFFSSCRRSEIVALDIADLAFNEKGVVLTLRRSKTDQEGVGCEVPVFYRPRDASKACPVLALHAWIDCAQIAEGPLFRSVWGKGDTATVGARRITTHTLANVVKRQVKKAGGLYGFDARSFGAHSLRRGSITSAAKRGTSLEQIAEISRHRSLQVLREYIEQATVMERNASLGMQDPHLMKMLKARRTIAVAERRGRIPEAPLIPVDDAEAAALFLAERMRPAVRVELGRLLIANSIFR